MSKKTIPPANDETQSQAVARYLTYVAEQAEAVRVFVSVWSSERDSDDDFATIMLSELAEYVCCRMLMAAHELKQTTETE